MKTPEFATENFIGLHTLNKHFARKDFTFRENKVEKSYIMKIYAACFINMLKNVKIIKAMPKYAR